MNKTGTAPTLSALDLEALAYVAETGGMVDVWSPQLARVLSDLHVRCPALFDRVNSEPDRRGSKPYFGVVLKAAGREALAEAVPTEDASCVALNAIRLAKGGRS